MERVAPKITEYALTGGFTEIYDPPIAPGEIPVTIKNEGPDECKVRMSTTNAIITLAAGDFLRVNTGAKIWARIEPGDASLVQTMFGVEIGSSRASTSGALSFAELEALAVSRTAKQLQAEILLELRIMNAYNAEMHESELTATDVHPSRRVLV